jgi:hypothetical protein
MNICAYEELNTLDIILYKDTDIDDDDNDADNDDDYNTDDTHKKHNNNKS